LTEGIVDVLNFTHTSYDIYNAFNLTSDTYLIPESGFYQVAAQYSISARVNDTYYIYFIKNNIIISDRQTACSSSSIDMIMAIADIVYCTTGDVITFYVAQYNPAHAFRVFYQFPAPTFCTIAKIP